MDDFMEWLYFYYILPILEEIPKGEYAEYLPRLKDSLTICQEIDFEHTLEFYTTNAFRLGLRTGVSLQTLLKQE